MPISEVIHVSLTALDAAPSQQSFDKLLFAAYHTVGPELIRDYSDPTSLATDFAAWPSVLAASQAFFAQNPHPVTLSIGRLTTARAKIFTLAPVAQNSTVYTITINGVDYSYTSDASATVKEICDNLNTTITAASISGLTVSDDDVTITLTSTAGVWYSVKVTRPDLFVVTETTAASGLSTELDAILNERDDCYGVAVEHQSEAVGNAVASWVASFRKIYGVASPNDGIRTSSTTDLASDLQAASNNRAFVMWDSAASAEFPEVARMSEAFPDDPGSRTWNFKRLINVTAQRVTGTDITNLKAKNASVVRTLGGLTLTFGSKMAGGRYIDVQHGMDWLQARLEVELYTLLANNKKVPYTDSGLAMIEGVVRKVLQEAVRNQFLADDDNLTVSITKVADQSSTDRANRIVRGIVFRGRLAGAVEEMFVSGTVFP